MHATAIRFIGLALCSWVIINLGFKSYALICGRRCWLSVKCFAQERNMAHITHYLPELDDPERSLIAHLTAAMSDAQVLQFVTAYRQARKDPQTILLMAVIG